MHQNGYVLNTETYNVEVKVNQTATQAIVNKEVTGTFKLTKENEDSSAKISGVQYKIWSEDKTYSELHTTSDKGEINIEGLKLRKIFLSGTTN